MENITTITIIIGFIGLISGLITIFDKIVNYRANLNFIKIPYQRVQAIIGDWKGTIFDIEGKNKKLYHAKLTISKVKGKKILGYFTAENVENGHTYLFDISGGFYKYNFIKFDYVNKHESVIQFGIWLTQLSSNAEFFTGKYVGYGSMRERIIQGYVELEKVTN